MLICISECNFARMWNSVYGYCIMVIIIRLTFAPFEHDLSCLKWHLNVLKLMNVIQMMLEGWNLYHPAFSIDFTRIMKTFFLKSHLPGYEKKIPAHTPLRKKLYHVICLTNLCLGADPRSILLCSVYNINLKISPEQWLDQLQHNFHVTDLDAKQMLVITKWIKYKNL